MNVRRFQPSDHEAVRRIDAGFRVESVAVISAQGRSFTWRAEPVVRPRQKVHDVAIYLRTDSNRWHAAYVAQHESGIAGFAAVELQSWNQRLVLSHMYVDRSARQLGVGRALLREVINTSTADVRHVWLETQDTNVTAILAYERMGFSIVGLDTSLYADSTDSEIGVFMCQPLRTND